jgi:hypothetical protein
MSVVLQCEDGPVICDDPSGYELLLDLAQEGIVGSITVPYPASIVTRTLDRSNEDQDLLESLECLHFLQASTEILNKWRLPPDWYNIFPNHICHMIFSKMTMPLCAELKSECCLENECVCKLIGTDKRMYISAMAEKWRNDTSIFPMSCDMIPEHSADDNNMFLGGGSIILSRDQKYKIASVEFIDTLSTIYIPLNIISHHPGHFPSIALATECFLETLNRCNSIDNGDAMMAMRILTFWIRLCHAGARVTDALKACTMKCRLRFHSSVRFRFVSLRDIASHYHHELTFTATSDLSQLDRLFRLYSPRLFE